MHHTVTSKFRRRPMFFVGMVAIAIIQAGLLSSHRADAATSVSVSAGSASIVEGDSGSRVLKIPVTLSAPAPSSVSINYAVSAGNATPGNLGTSNHFTPRLGLLKWTFNAAAGGTSVNQTVSIVIIPNTLADGDETLAVVLSNPSVGLTIAQPVGTATIIDDDSVTRTIPEVSVAGGGVYRGTLGKARYVYATVTLSAPASASVAFKLNTTAATAVAGTDFIAKSSTLQFSPGVVSKVVQLSVFPTLSTILPNLTFSVSLSNISGPAKFGRTNATIALLDQGYSGNLANPKVAVIGDSIVFVAQPSIAAALNPSYSYSIIGIPRYTIGDALPAFTRQLQASPSDAIINLGSDDALTNVTTWRTDFATLLSKIPSLHCVEFVTLNEPILDYFGSNIAGQTVTIAHDINAELIIQVQSNPQFHLIDWNAAVASDSSLTSDGIHPSATGSAWLANHYHDALVNDCG